MNFTTDEVKELLKAATELAIMNDQIYAGKSINRSYSFEFRSMSLEMSLEEDSSEVYLGVENADCITAIYDNYMMLDLIEELYTESMS